jgi:hypothetical protein
LIILSSPTPNFPPQKECQEKSLKGKSFVSFVDFVTQTLPSRDGRWEAIFNRSKWQPKVTLLLQHQQQQKKKKPEERNSSQNPKLKLLEINKEKKKKAAEEILRNILQEEEEEETCQKQAALGDQGSISGPARELEGPPGKRF